MITFIQDFINEYQKTLPVDWIESSYTWTNSTQGKAYYSDGIQRINKVIDLCFIYFSKSVISGEYIANANLTSNLEELSNILAGHEYPPIDKDQYQSRLFQEYKKLDDNIQIAINHYLQLIYDVKQKVSLEYHKFLVNAFATNGKHLSIDKIKDLIGYVFTVCAKDHSLSYDDNDIQKLILIYESLKEEEKLQKPDIKPIYIIIKDKCYFLIKKLVYFNGQTEYAINYQNRRIDTSHITSEYFEEYDKYFEFFHKPQYTNNEPLVYQWESRCIHNTVRIGQIIPLIKYYKDSGNATNQQVDNLISRFNALYDKLYNIYSKYSHREFDIYGLNTMKNYMYNCRLSFRMSNRNYTYNTFITDMEEIEYIQATTHIKNFYPYKKAISFLLSNIRKDITDSLLPEDTLTQKFETLHLYIKKFEDSIHWCQVKKFYPVQLMYNECSKSFDRIRVFTPSSYSRPIDYKALNDDLQQYKTDVGILKGEISLHKERTKIEALKTEIDASKKSNIEILSLFTAVITFLFGCVNIFSDKNNISISISQQILQIVCLGLILLLFVSAIYLLTLRREESIGAYFKHPRFYFFGLSILGYIVILCIIVIKVLLP